MATFDPAAPDARWQQLRSLFSAELEERVRALNDGLLRLERLAGDTASTGSAATTSPNHGEGADGDLAVEEIFDALFREAHSLKGAARMVQLKEVEQLAHALESALAQGRRGDSLPPRPWFDAAYRAADAIAELDHGAESGDPPLDLDALLAALEGLDNPAAEVASAQPPMAEIARAGTPDLAAELLTDKPAPTARHTTSPDPAGPALHPHHPKPSTTPAAVAAAAAAPAANERAASGRAAGQSVRVATGKLDALLAQAGELTVTHIRVEQRLGELRELRAELDAWRREWRSGRRLRGAVRAAAEDGSAGPALQREVASLLRFLERAEQRAQTTAQQVDEIATRLRHDTAQLGLVAREIQGEVMAVRLVPVASLSGALERAMRDLTQATGKEAHLSFEGGETEIDRKILEALRDPLLHMLRNAVDHGIEPAAERERLGKPRAGAVHLAARQRGDTIEIEVSDDGAGLDAAVVRERALRKGLIAADQAAALDDEAACQLVFLPGFSTRDEVTETSGRGVGLDVVREYVQRLNGRVGVSGRPGDGACFTMRLPLTLATTRAMLVEEAGQVFAIPSSAVERSGRVRQQQLLRVEGRWAVPVDGRPVPAVELGTLLRLAPPAGRPDSPAPASWRPYFVLHQGGRRVVVLADGLVGEQEIVVKSLGWPLKRVRNVGGSTTLASGQLVVILNPTDLLQSAFETSSAPVAAPSPAALDAAAHRKHRVLVVDDSLTTRTLERSILEAAGYAVAVAADGEEALHALRAASASSAGSGGSIDLVVSDVQMPRLDGFGLTAAIRRDEKLRHVPVVLVTSLDAREYRERGVEAGADAYIVKGAFDQGQLLETIGRLL